MEYVTKELIPATGFSIAVYCTDKGIIPDSASDYYALLFLHKGKLELQSRKAADNCSMSVAVFTAPCVICIVPGHTITAADFPDDGCSTILFRPDGLNCTFQTLPDTFVFSFLRKINAPGYASLFPDVLSVHKIQQLYTAIDFHMNKEQGEFWPCYARSYLLELLMLTDRLQYQPKKIAQAVPLPETQKATEIFQFLNVSYDTAINVDQLAKQFATNRTSLNTLFKKVCGMSVIEYITALRISIASDLLIDTGMTIKEIAERTGFSEETYFFRAFKKKTGITPGEFRKQQPNPYGRQWEERHFRMSVS